MSTLRKPVASHLLIVGGVVLLHGVALWGLQSGLVARVVENVIAVEVIAQLMEPPRPKVEPPPPPVAAKPLSQPVVQKVAALPPPPMPLAIADPTPAPNAPTGVLAPPTPLPLITAPVAAAPAMAQVAAPKVELPVIAADFLHKAVPAYPKMSIQMNEHGTVMVKVLIGVDGVVKQSNINQSSGYPRLDQAALNSVQSWRFTPGKRGGVPEAMWYVLPIKFDFNSE